MRRAEPTPTVAAFWEAGSPSPGDGGATVVGVEAADAPGRTEADDAQPQATKSSVTKTVNDATIRQAWTSWPGPPDFALRLNILSART
jgi:hypothetical protein